MILESIVTTCDSHGTVNVAPMGCEVNPDFQSFILRPFQPSRTYDNLLVMRSATIHVTDDACLFAKAVTGNLAPPPTTIPCEDGRWHVLPESCRYFCVEVIDFREDVLRATAQCKVIKSNEIRPFYGFNRAKHAIIEAAILATRTHLIPRESIVQQLQWLAPWIEKTGGTDERQAWELLTQSIQERLADQDQQKNE